MLRGASTAPVCAPVWRTAGSRRASVASQGPAPAARVEVESRRGGLLCAHHRARAIFCLDHHHLLRAFSSPCGPTVAAMPVLAASAHPLLAARAWPYSGGDAAADSGAGQSSRLDLTSTQRTTVIVACCYIAAIALLSWLPVVNWVFYPFRLLAVGFHEFSHAAMGLLTCARIEGIELDPYEGGVTRMRGGISALTLPAGYLGSSFVGAALIACGFDEKAAKIASIVVGVFFLITLWWARRDWFTWLLVIVRPWPFAACCSFF